MPSLEEGGESNDDARQWCSLLTQNCAALIGYDVDAVYVETRSQEVSRFGALEK